MRVLDMLEKVLNDFFGQKLCRLTPFSVLWARKFNVRPQFRCLARMYEGVRGIPLFVGSIEHNTTSYVAHV